MRHSETLSIAGEVASGLGKGAHFVGLDWVQSRLCELMGEPPFRGTLNVRVPGHLRDELFAMRERFAPIVSPDASGCPGYLVAVILRNEAGKALEAWTVLPDLTVHADILEVVSPRFLRDCLALQDGDRLYLQIRI